MPWSTSPDLTALARCSDSRWLCAASPVESVRPTIRSDIGNSEHLRDVVEQRLGLGPDRRLIDVEMDAVEVVEVLGLKRLLHRLPTILLRTLLRRLRPRPRETGVTGKAQRDGYRACPKQVQPPGYAYASHGALEHFHVWFGLPSPHTDQDDLPPSPRHADRTGHHHDNGVTTGAIGQV